MILQQCSAGSVVGEIVFFCNRRIQESFVVADNGGNGGRVAIQRRRADQEISRSSDQRQIQRRTPKAADFPHSRHLQHEPSQKVVTSGGSDRQT